MDLKTYRKAFSSIQPSPAAVDRLLDIPEEAPKQTRSIRWGTLAAAAVLAVLLLSGAVYAAVSWFRLTDGNTIRDPVVYVSGEASRPAPQHAIELEDPEGGNYIGFTLDGWTVEARKDGGSTMLKGWLETHSPEARPTLDEATLEQAYVRYYPVGTDGELLCVEVLDRGGLGYRDYFIRYETELVKEGTLKGMETVWLTIKGQPLAGGDTEDTWHLFCRNAEWNCVLVISSNRSFERCEEAASHLTLVNSGVPVVRSDTKTICGFRLPDLPAGYTVNTEYTHTLGDALAEQGAAGSCPEAADAYGYLLLTREEDERKLIIYFEDDTTDHDHVSGYHLERTETIEGHEALWYSVGENVTVLLYRYADGTQAHLCSHSSGPETEALLADLARGLEPVRAEISQEPPLEFFGLAMG